MASLRSSRGAVAGTFFSSRAYRGVARWKPTRRAGASMLAVCRLRRIAYTVRVWLHRSTEQMEQGDLPRFIGRIRMVARACVHPK